MLSFEEFRRSPICKRPVWTDEDTPQDASAGMKKLREDQERQYQAYIAINQPKEQEQTSEEKRVAEKLIMLRNKQNGQSGPVTLQTKSNETKSRAEYMRGYRKRPKKCPHCGKEIK